VERWREYCASLEAPCTPPLPDTTLRKLPEMPAQNRKLVAVGDPHGDYKPLLKACHEHQPEAVILLGDCDLERPLREELAPVFAAGIRVLWIHGNHDADRPHWHANLFDGHPEGSLHARWQQVGGLIIGGLGGVFRESVWYPRVDADAEPVRRTRLEFLRRLSKPSRWKGGIPMKHHATIFPEDFEKLRRFRLDVLVTHEAPTTHKHGFAALDKLARETRAKLLIHGHHHYSYEAELPKGTRVRGLGKAEPWVIEL
jgi:predicted phosphodiesterase